MSAKPILKPSIFSRVRIIALITVMVLLALAVILGLSSALARNDNSVAHPAIANTNDVSIVDFNFQPNVVTITVGSSVSWTNSGTFTHTVTSDTGVWDSGDIGPGQSFIQTFDKPGQYLYHCIHHPSMKGMVVVETKIFLPITAKE